MSAATEMKRPGCDRGAETNVESNNICHCTAIVGRNHTVPHLELGEIANSPQTISAWPAPSSAPTIAC